MYCKECGFQLSEGTKYCPNCGTKVELSGMGNIEQNAVWGNIDDEDTAGDSNSVAKKAHWENGHGGAENVQEKTEEKKPKQIKKKRKRKKIETYHTTSEHIYVKGYAITVWPDYDFKPSAPEWYVDADGKRISDDYDEVSRDIINDTATIVYIQDEESGNSRYACGKFENNKLKVITRPCFEGYSDKHCVNLKELEKSGFLLRKELPRDLESTAECGDDIYFYDDMGLYKTQKETLSIYKNIIKSNEGVGGFIRSLWYIFFVMYSVVILPVEMIIAWIVNLTELNIIRVFIFPLISTFIVLILWFIAFLCIKQVRVKTLSLFLDSYYFDEKGQIILDFNIKKGQVVTDSDIFL